MSSTTQQNGNDLDPAIVDAIVRQVMERLSLLNSAETGTANNHTANRQPFDADSKRVESSSESGQVLQLKERVVTLESLRGRLNGKKKLVVGRNAVLTPAVHDELKSHGVELELAPPSEKKSGATGQAFCLARLANHFVPVDWLKDVGLESVCCGEDYSQLGDKLASENALGKSICLAAQPFVAVSVLNRNPGLRVAFGRTAKEVTEIMATLNANVLVLDTVQSRKELLELIRLFVEKRTSRFTPSSLDPGGNR